MHVHIAYIVVCYDSVRVLSCGVSLRKVSRVRVRLFLCGVRDRRNLDGREVTSHRIDFSPFADSGPGREPFLSIRPTRLKTMPCLQSALSAG